MIIKNLEDVKSQLRKHLTRYLKQHGIVFAKNKFQCPNHKEHKCDDKKPAAAFYPDVEHFNCFVCEKAGDIFTAAHLLEGKPLTGNEFITENVMYLADKFEIAYDAKESLEEKKNKELYKVLEVAAKRMHKVLSLDHPEVNKVRDYITERDWDDVSEKFLLGYCNFDKLIGGLKQAGFSEENIINAGLGDEAEIVLNKRLVFPIKNQYGKVIGFVGREIDGISDSGIKYINSPTNELYCKSETLYNLDQVRGEDSIYIVEGYADVITMVRYGYNVVGLGGVAFTPQHYEQLVANGIKKVTFCLDGDDAGRAAANRIIREIFLDKPDIRVYIKYMPDGEDPDSILQTKGADTFDSAPSLELFDYLLDEYKKNMEDESTKTDLFKCIIVQTSFIAKERMCRKLARDIDVSSDTIAKEIIQYENTNKVSQVIKQSDILLAKFAFEKEIDAFDDWSWHREGLLGLDTGYDILNQKIDGIQDGFYIIGGNENIGKSAFAMSLALNVLKRNEEVFMIYFSIDDNIRKMIPRILASDARLPINWIRNPKLKIKDNPAIPAVKKEEWLRRRQNALDNLKQLTHRFFIRDASHGVTMEQIEHTIQLGNLMAKGNKLVIVIDSIHKLESDGPRDGLRDKYIYLANRIKDISDIYRVPIIGIAELKKSYGKRPTNDDITETKKLSYNADVIFLLYSDLDDNPDTHLKFTDVNGRERPIIDVSVSKNKTSDFKGKLFYKFHKTMSRLEECTEVEMRHLRNPD